MKFVKGLIISLSLLWLIPLSLWYKIRLSPWIFLFFALFFTVIAYFAAPLYDWATGIARRLGHRRIVAFRERIRNDILSAAVTALWVMTIFSLLFFFLRIL